MTSMITLHAQTPLKAIVMFYPFLFSDLASACDRFATSAVCKNNGTPCVGTTSLRFNSPYSPASSSTDESDRLIPLDREITPAL